ncbi:MULTISPECIES: cyclic-di-AMP-binding protein CbpB [unclassified Enterococcus]|jgi:CBS-domain-containing membrane protein|uniref:cyclic-di-AMP-binding protein CbpB n=1 Tax=unclassified Enterococcus TaxID=2608891 RepID=UPI003D27ABF8
MIGPAISELLLENQETFLVPAENVANVMHQHPLSHGLLVLSKVGYTKIPVLDKQDHFVGLVGLSGIVNKMMDLNEISMEPLEGLTVADVMETEVPTINESWELEDVLHLLVDASFLPVVDDNQVFKGIITRKELLKAVNFMVHELERRNILTPRNVEEMKSKVELLG